MTWTSAVSEQWCISCWCRAEFSCTSWSSLCSVHGWTSASVDEWSGSCHCPVWVDRRQSGRQWRWVEVGDDHITVEAYTRRADTSVHWPVRRECRYENLDICLNLLLNIEHLTKICYAVWLRHAE